MIVLACVACTDSTTLPPGPDSSAADPVFPAMTAAVVGPVASFVGVAMNDSGQIAANTADTTTANERALRWTSGHVDTLEFNGWRTAARNIGNAGDVVGVAYDPTSTFSYHAILWPAGQTVGVDLLGTTANAIDISSHGLILTSNTAGVFVIDGDRTDTIPVGPPGLSTVTQINDQGWMLGRTSQFGPNQPAVRRPDGVVGGFGGRGQAVARWLSNAHTVVGETEFVVGQGNQPFLAEDFGSTVNLATYYGPWVREAHRVNVNAWVVALTDSLTSPGPNGGQWYLLADSTAVSVPSLVKNRSLTVNNIFSLTDSNRLLVDANLDGQRQLVILTPSTN